MAASTGDVNVNIHAASLHVVGKVAVGKPWYLSKKMWVSIITTALVIYCTITGKTENLADVLATIARVAGILGVFIPLIFKIAHRDGKELDLAMAVVGLAKDLGTPEVATLTPGEPVTPAPGKFDAPGLTHDPK